MQVADRAAHRRDVGFRETDRGFREGKGDGRFPVITVQRRVNNDDLYVRGRRVYRTSRRRRVHCNRVAPRRPQITRRVVVAARRDTHRTRTREVVRGGEGRRVDLRVRGAHLQVAERAARRRDVRFRKADRGFREGEGDSRFPVATVQHRVSDVDLNVRGRRVHRHRVHRPRVFRRRAVTYRIRTSSHHRIVSVRQRVRDNAVRAARLDCRLKFLHRPRAVGHGQSDSAANREIARSRDHRRRVTCIIRRRHRQARAADVHAVTFLVRCRHAVAGSIRGDDAGVDGPVAVGNQIGTRNSDAEGITRGHRTREDLPVDTQRHRVAHLDIAPHRARNGDHLLRFGSIDDVVGRDVLVKGNHRNRCNAVDDAAVYCRQTDVPRRVSQSSSDRQRLAARRDVGRGDEHRD